MVYSIPICDILDAVKPVFWEDGDFLRRKPLPPELEGFCGVIFPWPPVRLFL